MLVRSDPEEAERPLVPVLEAGAADHLGADEASTVSAALAPEGLDAHARHRGEDETGGDPDLPELPGLAKIYLHRKENGTRGAY
jgi:hypothetical protein